jgi:biopolymer transport protein ExbB
MLAKGISEAMNCTAFGLMAAIIALMGFAAHNTKTQKLIDDINAATVQVVNLVVNNRSRIQLDESQAA